MQASSRFKTAIVAQVSFCSSHVMGDTKARNGHGRWSKTDRTLIYAALILLVGGLLYGLVAAGLPLYWRFSATVLRPFHSGASSASVKGTSESS